MKTPPALRADSELGAGVGTQPEASRELSPGRKLALIDGVQAPRESAAAAPLTIRVLIADAHGLVRAGLRALLESERRIAVVGEAATCEDAVAQASRTRPDVVLIDTRLPGLGSIEAAGRIRAESGPAVMLLTASEEEEDILAGLRAGASGVLLKDTTPIELVRGIELLARGDAMLSPCIARRLIAEFVAIPEPVWASPGLVDELTAREREVVQLVALGWSNNEIAERLTVTLATAKTHVSRAMVKLHAHDRAKLVVFAYETGLAMPRALVRRAA